MPPTALEATERATIDMQISTAKRYPRSIEAFKKRALSMATLDEETAESCLYSRPVGKDPETGKQKYAEGMSVRMAEIVGASYGNLRVQAVIVEQTERFVRARGMAIDLESNFASSSEVIESTVKKNGQPYDERMRVVIAKSALAKARRDATFQVVPRALAKPIESEVRKVLMGESKSLDKRRALAAGWISKLGIDPVRVYTALGIAGESELTAEILETLTGLKTSIKDNEVSIDEAFPQIGNKDEGGDTRTMSQKLADKKKAEDEAKAKAKTDGAGKGKETPPPEEKKPDPTPETKTETTPATSTDMSKTYTAEDRANLIENAQNLMIDGNVSESKLMAYAKGIPGLVPDGITAFDELPTAAIDKLSKAIPALAKKG
jgi:hypothetical protein